MSTRKDPIIKLLEENPKSTELLGKAWEILYFEGKSPDVGKRRENFIVTMLKEEFGLKVEQAPDTEPEWDFKVYFNDGERYYNLKTTEGFSTVKLAWDGFPSEERILKFKFRHNILYVVGDRDNHKIEIFVIDINDLKELQRKTREHPDQLEQIWWLPKSGTNPRGFGLKVKTIRELTEKAKQKDNYIGATYEPLPADKYDELREAYFRGWYKLIKKIALGEE